MIICDKCKQPIETEVYLFGKTCCRGGNVDFSKYRYEYYDLCEGCAEKVKNTIDECLKGGK